MKSLPMTLLKNREEFWSRVEAQDLRWSELPSLIVFIGLACALYGTVLAGWRSPRLALYVAAKLPLLFLGTAAFVAVFNWMVSALLGSGLSFKSTVFAVFAGSSRYPRKTCGPEKHISPISPLVFSAPAVPSAFCQTTS